jgi:hypothetical protein
MSSRFLHDRRKLEVALFTMFGDTYGAARPWAS